MFTRQNQKVWFFLAFFFFAMAIFTKEPSAAPYYQGKRINIIVCSAPGGGYDQMARLIARHLSKYIPGAPSVIVENMPGGANIIAGNYLYNIAKPDGLTIGAMNRAFPLMQLAKREGMRFDTRKYSWIGSVAVESTVLAIRTDLPYKTFDDLMRTKEKIYLGTSGEGSQDHIFPLLLEKLLGLNNLNLVIYESSSATLLAIERKEVDGKSSSYTVIKPFVARGVVRLLLRGRVSEPGIENLPVNEDFTTDQKAKTIMGLQDCQGLIGRPYMAPPGTPANIMSILRDAFANVVKDPELIKEANKRQMPVQYTPVDECLKTVNFVLNQPEDIVKEFSKYVKF